MFTIAPVLSKSRCWKTGWHVLVNIGTLVFWWHAHHALNDLSWSVSPRSVPLEGQAKIPKLSRENTPQTLATLPADPSGVSCFAFTVSRGLSIVLRMSNEPDLLRIPRSHSRPRNLSAGYEYKDKVVSSFVCCSKLYLLFIQHHPSIWSMHLAHIFEDGKTVQSVKIGYASLCQCLFHPFLSFSTVNQTQTCQFANSKETARAAEAPLSVRLWLEIIDKIWQTYANIIKNWQNL